MRWLPLALILVACTGDDEETGTAGPEPGPFEVTLGDPEGCAPSIAIKPESAADIDTWIGGRLTPPGYPARIDEVTVGFDGRVPCSITVPSAVRVGIGGAEPPANPETLRFAEIEASDSNGPGVVYTIPIDGARNLELGEHVWIYAQVQGSMDEMRCLTLCQDIDNSDVCYWSGTSDTPYQWRNIGEVGQLALAMKGATLPAN